MRARPTSPWACRVRARPSACRNVTASEAPTYGLAPVGSDRSQARELLPGLEHPALAVRVGVDELRRVGEVVVAGADRSGDRCDQVADALDRFDVPAGLTGRDGLARRGQRHLDHVAEGPLGEIGDSDADQAGPVDQAAPQVINAISQVSKGIGHFSSYWVARRRQRDVDGRYRAEARADGVPVLVAAARRRPGWAGHDVPRLTCPGRCRCRGGRSR